MGSILLIEPLTINIWQLILGEYFSCQEFRGLEVVYIYFRLTFQNNTVRHQNITKLKCEDVKLDQLSRCQNEKVRVKTANKNLTGQQYYINFLDTLVDKDKSTHLVHLLGPMHYG